MTKLIAFGLLGAAILAGFLSPNAAFAEDDSPGHKLFREKGCIGCHSIGGQGGQVGPALDHVGDRYAAEWIYTWIRDPAAVKPGTLMPKLPLTDDERALDYDPRDAIFSRLSCSSFSSQRR